MATISEQLTQLASIKSDIKDAIEAKGETVGNDAFSTYATHIGNISSGGGGGGGFRCTNKLMLQGEPLVGSFYSSLYSYSYTFDGELDSAALTILKIGDGGHERLIACENASSSAKTIINGLTITATDFVFQDKFKEPEYSAPSGRKLISHKLTLTDSYTNSYIEINDYGTLSIYNQYTSGVYMGDYIIMVIFKGKDGSYDFDVFVPYIGEDD